MTDIHRHPPHTEPVPCGEHAPSPDASGCIFLQAHPDVLEGVKAAELTDIEQGRLSELFRMFADPTRLRILGALQVSELCVCDLAQLLGMTVSAISHQLRLLRSAGLVTGRREGKAVVYALADDHVRIMMQNGIDHIRE